MANNNISNKFSNDQHQQEEDSDSYNRFELTLGRLKNVEARKNLVHQWATNKLNINNINNTFPQATISNNLMFGLNFEINDGHSNLALNASQLNFNLKNSELNNSHNNSHSNSHNLFNEQSTVNNLNNKNNNFNESNNDQINLVNGRKLVNITNELNGDVEHVCQQQPQSNNDKISNINLDSTNNYSSFNRKQLDLVTNLSSSCNQNNRSINSGENSGNNLSLVTCSLNTSTNISQMLNTDTNLNTYNCITSFPSLIKREKNSNFEYQLHHYGNVQNTNYSNNVINFGVNQNSLNQLQLPNHHMVTNSISNANMNILNNCFSGNSNTPNLINNYETFNCYNNLNGYNLSNINSTLSNSINSNSSNTNFSNSCQLSNTICSVDNMISNNNLIIRNNLSNQISPIDMQDQERIKLERKRLRNRIAASKCRHRKLERISKLEESNNLLKIDVENLNKLLTKTKNQNSLLKDQILEHINSGCNINKDLLTN